MDCFSEPLTCNMFGTDWKGIVQLTNGVDEYDRKRGLREIDFDKQDK